MKQAISLAKDCGALSKPVNGDVSTPDGTGIGATAVYSCNQGYTCPDCENPRECQDTFSQGVIWSGYSSTCHGMIVMPTGFPIL